MKPEQQMHRALCQWLKLAHPSIYFESDPSGLRVSVGLRAILKSTRSNHAHIDLFIAEPRGHYHGMFIELKSKTPFKKDGSLKKDEHLEAQAITMANLTTRGYHCIHAWTLNDAMEEINSYLNLCKFGK